MSCGSRAMSTMSKVTCCSSGILRNRRSARSHNEHALVEYTMSELTTNEIPIEGRAGNPILMHTLRYAPAAVAARYPLDVRASASWTRNGNGWTARFDLPELANDYIVVPSVALFDDHSASEYRIDLTEGR